MRFLLVVQVMMMIVQLTFCTFFQTTVFHDLAIGAYSRKFRAQRSAFTVNPSPPGGGGSLWKVLAIRVFLPDFVAISPAAGGKFWIFSFV